MIRKGESPPVTFPTQRHLRLASPKFPEFATIVAAEVLGFRVVVFPDMLKVGIGEGSKLSIPMESEGCSPASAVINHHCIVLLYVGAGASTYRGPLEPGVDDLVAGRAELRDNWNARRDGRLQLV